MKNRKQVPFITMQIEVSIDEFIEPFERLTNSEAIEIIQAINLSFGEISFTEDTVKVLLKMLKDALKDDFDIMDYAPK